MEARVLLVTFTCLLDFLSNLSQGEDCILNQARCWCRRFRRVVVALCLLFGFGFRRDRISKLGQVIPILTHPMQLVPNALHDVICLSFRFIFS